jgi:hypothetical protein
MGESYGNYPGMGAAPGGEEVAARAGWWLKGCGGAGLSGMESKSPELLRDFDMFCFIEEIETISFLQPS